MGEIETRRAQNEPNAVFPQKNDRAKSCLQIRNQSVLKGVLRLNNAAAERPLWDTVISRRCAYHTVCAPSLPRIALKADALRSKSPNGPHLFRSKAQVRRHSGSISRACNAAPEQIRPVPTGVLSAAAPLDLFRFGVVKMLGRRFRRRLRFSLSQNRKISISKLQASKNTAFDEMN